MAPLTAWLPAHCTQDFDLIVKIVGPGASSLLKEWSPIAQSLLDQGFAVMAQSENLNGDRGDCVLGIRIAAQPFFSMGHGCDVLVHLSDSVPEFWRFNLQPGSVLLWEPPAERRLYPALPDGVIAYPIPLTALCLRHGEGLPGKALAALGVLLHLLGVSDEDLRRWTPFVSAPRSFSGGVAFARDSIQKRDAYSIPLSSTEEQSRIMLTPQQAILLGYAVSCCECRTTCEDELVDSSTQWMAEHMEIAGAVVSILQNEKFPGVQAYRGPQGKVLALLRGEPSAITFFLDGLQAPRLLVAADIPDALALLIVGHELIRRGLSDGVGVLIDETVAGRHQSVEVHVLAEMIRRREIGAQGSTPSVRSGSAAFLNEPAREDAADVGFLAWGAAQGVVRDAVGLCRSFGLRVAALYPNLIVPFPTDEVEAFAKGVKRVVLVESNPLQGYCDRLRASCSFNPAVLKPPPGQSLTPMDIFLREGLGTS